MLGCAVQLVALARLSIGDITGPHDSGYVGLFLVGLGAMLHGVIWATRPGRRGRAAPPVAHIAPWCALGLLALIGWVAASDALNAIAVGVVLAAAGYCTARALSSRRVKVGPGGETE